MRRTSFKLISVIFILICFGTTSCGSKRKFFEEDMAMNCFGIVKDFKVVEESRGTSYYYINDDWKYLGSYGYELRNIVRVGDSVAKEQNQPFLFLYRKTEQENYFVFRKLKPANYEYNKDMVDKNNW